MNMDEFARTVWSYYEHSGRHDLPWRLPTANNTFDPYGIMVSELMLQQTQVARVVPKFEVFLAAFPTVDDLARAPLREVLEIWSGLGYNRRAKFLHQAAQDIVQRFGGRVPDNQADLVSLPGIGANTAGAILAYAYDQPTMFVETNIRTVMFRHFFQDANKVSDAEVGQKVTETLQRLAKGQSPRTWYWALMDYGTHLKQTTPDVIQKSQHYKKQSAFQGSARQIRGQVLRLLVRPHSFVEIQQAIQDERLPKILGDLEQEQLISHIDGQYHLGV